MRLPIPIPMKPWLTLFLLVSSARPTISIPTINFNDAIISHPPFSGVNPDGGLGYDNEGGRTRREPGQPVFSSIDDDVFPTERGKEERSDMVELLERYAPVFKLSVKEEYFPSSVEFMLSHYDHVVNWSGMNVPVNTSLITPRQVDHLPQSGLRLALSISDPHNPQPSLNSAASNYLQGVLPTFTTKRGEVHENVYGIWVDRGRGIVDLHYWMYYPFNFGKGPFGPVGWLGHHVSDWERLRVRTVNGTATAVDYNVHAGPGSVGTVRWEDVPKVDDRPVAYVAAGSHGVWSTPGHHVYADLLNVFKLVDETDDKGPIWDTKSHVVPIQWWHGPTNGSRVQHDGPLRWMNFRGRWGNLGDRGWLNTLLPACHVVDAPGGPNRDFRGAMDCAVGEASSNQTTSTYSFLLRKEMAQFAHSRGVTEIKVEQICERSQHNEGDEDDDHEHDDDDYQYGEQDGGGRYLVWAFSTHKTESTVKFNGTEKHTLSVPACKSRKNAISSYRLTFCTPHKCLIPSHERPICTHQYSKPGYTPTKAVVLDDLDEWSWDVSSPSSWQKMMDEAVGMANRFFVRTWVMLITVIQ